MENASFFDGMLKFYEILNENPDNMDSAIDSINEALKLVAGDIKLGRASMTFCAPKSNLEPEGVYKNEDHIFGSDGYESEGVVKHFSSREGSRLTISLFPVKGTKWSGKEASMIELLAKNCYFYGGKARTSGLMEKSICIDNMTGVDNTDGFMRYGGMLTATGRLSGFAAVYINIKNFKYVNKIFGNRQGDMMLRKFSHTMSGYIGNDGKFARLGGDNFIVLIRKENLTAFLEFAKGISYEMGEGSAKQNYDVMLRMGVYEAREGDTMSDIMNKSSIAYNAARADERKDIMIFSPVLLEEAIHKKEISTLFPKALEDGEFLIYYQPKVRLSDNKLCGCEALCRWIRNGRIVPPMEFIPVLETEGTVCDLDFYVFEAVCADIRHWIDMGVEPVRVSVNFSKRHLHDKKLADKLLNIINKYGIDSKYIEVELTEMTSAEDLSAMRHFVDIMKQNGVGTSIDDFGTGYSSLNLLKDLDVDVIKLDKSFFTNINEEGSEASTDRIVVKNIVNMVNELNMEAISEGVETHAQADFLRETHCSMAQGFLFDRPLPKDEFEKRLCDGEFYVNKG